MSPNLWRVKKGLKSQEAIFIISFRAQSIVLCSPKKLHEKNKDILETEVEDAKSRHVAFVQLPEARWSTAVCQTGIEKEWKKPKLLRAIVSSPPIGARLPLAARFVGFITWICSIRCLHCCSSCMNLSAEKVTQKKKKTGFIMKTESRPQATPFDECQPNCIKMCKKKATLSHCNANTQELKSDCSIGSPTTNKGWLMIFGFCEPLAMWHRILRFKWMADFLGNL